MSNIAIIGAGVAGLSTARELHASGYAVTVFDRGRKPGGRCSTKDYEHQFDHGAQYFTVDDKRFAAMIATLENLNAVKPWSGKFARLSDGIPTPLDDDTARYVGVPGMRALCDALAGELTINSSNHVNRLELSARGWRLINSDDSDLGEYDAVTLAMPPEQARSLVPRGSPLRSALAPIRSEPSWALMLAFDQRLPVEFDSAAIDRDDVVWAARDSAKPGRPVGERWVVHAASQWAQRRFRDDPERVAGDLLTAFFSALKIPPVTPQFMKAHRWGLAFPRVETSCGALWDDELRLGVCGDWCIAPRIEGAYLSGLACAELIVEGLRVEKTGNISEFSL